MSASNVSIRDSKVDLATSSSQDVTGDIKSNNHSASASPVPPLLAVASQPSPLSIGISFIKQYYKVLTSSPEQILKFYKAETSSLSHSLEASTPADVITLESNSAPAAVFHWAKNTATLSAEGGDSTSETAIAKDILNDSDATTSGLRFDFGRGAIDAQETINGGILVVVTGLITLPVSPETSKPFVHTFLLNNGAPPGKKKQFYVHNDILRIMADSSIDTYEEEQLECSPSQPETGDISASSTVPVGEEERELVFHQGVDLTMINQNMTTSQSSIVNLDSTEEIKTHIEEEIEEKEVLVIASNVSSLAVGGDTIIETSRTDEKRKRSKRGSRNRKAGTSSPVEKAESADNDENGTNNAVLTSTSSMKTGSSKANKTSTDATAPVKIKVPSSWASLVAGGAASSTASNAHSKTSLPALAKVRGLDLGSINAVDETKVGIDIENTHDVAMTVNNTTTSERHTAQDPSSAKVATFTEPTAGTTHTSGGAKASHHNRTPEATLLLKNIPEKAKENELRAMFEPYATQLQKKIVGITLQASRGFCFIDFDSRDVVDAILLEIQQVHTKPEENKGKEDAGAGKKFVLHGRPLDVGRKIPLADAGAKGRSGAANSSGGARSQNSSVPENVGSQKRASGGGTSSNTTGQGSGKRRSSPRGGGSRGGGHRSTTTVGGGN